MIKILFQLFLTSGIIVKLSINICLELEQVEKHFEFAAWKLYCVLNGINKNNYDKYKWVQRELRELQMICLMWICR